MQSSQRHPADVRPEYPALGFLEKESLHGYEIWQRYESVLGKVWHISQSQLYLILKRLEARGLLSSGPDPEGGGRGRRKLSMTEEGRKRFLEWLAAPSDCSSRIIRLEFISRLYFAGESHRRSLRGMIRRQNAAVARQLENHRTLLASLPRDDRFNRLSIELRIGQLEAIGLWIDESVARLFPAR